MGDHTKQELVVVASKEAGFSKAVDVVNFSEQEQSVILVEEALRHIANNLPDHGLWKDPQSFETNLERTFASQRIKVSCALTLKYRDRCIIRHGYEQAMDTLLARQPSEIADTEGMEAVFTNGGTAVAEVQPEGPDLCIGRRVACHFEITPPGD